MSGGFASVDVADGIATVTLRRAERRNALHPAAHHELAEHWDRLAADPTLRVVILTGEGPVFCAGYDLLDNLDTGVMDLPASGFGGLTRRTDFPVPLIAAVNGPAMGGGFEMALACDLIVASDTARFALPEPKVGWAALGGGIQRLPRAIGIKQAMGMILTGRTIDAEEALALGLINDVAPAELLIDAARRWAGQIVACAPIAVRCSKQAAYAGLDMPLAAALDPANHPLASAVLASDDAEEGKRAFADRRPPRWRNQ
ncbi:enoyl-CoA hydratase-related protein [Sphingomonas aliaeris]|uniref:enoyl-CoA hydratase-related protein n=1 Tax=Sphingomonas aliaeris TaxID=2759526 RepID=UPI001CECA626|nr:enoyl-CoA hydratase-related protein [Sphingomonas aliaeris]